ncbi:hypothetical protein N0P26_002065 [Acinetobacter baumannii]|nr:hypothetical protein [Acinetobacter baumannii]EKT7960720.1 hypothetical protein [Acinetobacter baumannii]EKT9270184.1 hypothetical protein [Acinetobacter baumannii]EKT9312441.1 hypothetical protein [Acinetobacter baumannii]EKU0108386.1 hypothetical protein [Acinetobacter baumannii]EKU0260539.1 hypothetical protein [Acinetobacter baumannii]
MEIYSLKKLAKGCYLHVLHLKDYDVELLRNIDEKIIQICEGDSESPLDLVKKRLKDFLSSKDLRTKQGAIAEFFIHLYLNNNNYKPEFIFYNLEETSIKKGFDGFYSKENETYIVESKSGSCTSKKISHSVKINEAYQDIVDNLSGKSKKGKNNPWKNAYYHANLIDVGSAKSIRSKIAELRENFDRGIFCDVKDFNIIPCSTIFLDDIWTNQWSDDFIRNNSVLEKISGKNIDVIVVTKKNIKHFEDYLNV